MGCNLQACPGAQESVGPCWNEQSDSYAANSDIAEIDARLQALQVFLKAAKASCNFVS
jgi:hypothetical protein